MGFIYNYVEKLNLELKVDIFFESLIWMYKKRLKSRFGGKKRAIISMACEGRALAKTLYTFDKFNHSLRVTDLFNYKINSIGEIGLSKLNYRSYGAFITSDYSLLQRLKPIGLREPQYFIIRIYLEFNIL